MAGLLLPVVVVDEPRPRDDRDRGGADPALPGSECRGRHRHHQPRVVIRVLRVHGRKSWNRIRLSKVKKEIFILHLDFCWSHQFYMLMAMQRK